MANDLPKTPMLDELEKGTWPSFVKEIKTAAARNPMSRDLLGQLELSYKEKLGHWKHGGIVGVMGYGGGVIGRYSDVPDKFPKVSHFHTMRINQPSGWFYTSDTLRKICDIWDKHGSSLTNMHGSTGDIILLGCVTDELEPTFADLTEIGFDLGGSGSDVRTPSCCVGPARCEWSCYDTLKTCYNFTQRYQDELHRPAFPYKWKFKFSGCANDCVAAKARADISVIGTWRDDIRIDQGGVAEYVKNGLNLVRDVIGNCPGKCMEWDSKKLLIDNSNCRRCMHCINVMPKALRPGTDVGATVLIGSKAPIIEGAFLSSVLIPFIRMDDQDEVDEFCDLMEEIIDVWCDEGKSRERIGEFIQRVGMGNFLEAVGLEPTPEMVAFPRDNPYVFYAQEKEGEESED